MILAVKREMMQGRIHIKTTLLVQALLLFFGWGLVWLTDIKFLLWGTLGVSALGWGLFGAIFSTLIVAFPRIFPNGIIYKRLKALNKMFYEVMKHLSWSAIILISLFAGFGEELLFRSFLQAWLGDLTHYSVGIIIAALIFGAFHFSSLTHAVFAFILGLLLGVAYHLTQSFIFVAVWHTLHDLIALTVLVKFPKLLGLHLTSNDTKEI